MCDWQNYIQVVNDLQHRLVGNRRLLESILAWAQEAIKETDRIGLILKKCVSDTALNDVSRENAYTNSVAVADGKLLTRDQAGILDRDSFDIVLNIPGQSLKVRDEKKHQFLECDLNILGTKRFNLLEYILENPHITIGVHNIHQVHLYEEGIQANSLSKCIGVLRSVLQPTGRKVPYIINAKVVSRCSKSEQITGYGYRMSPNYRYLVILENISNSQDFPLPRPS
jgi:DNA-binding winged helix-turn-helix (wHTH) protein